MVRSTAFVLIALGVTVSFLSGYLLEGSQLPAEAAGWAGASGTVWVGSDCNAVNGALPCTAPGANCSFCELNPPETWALGWWGSYQTSSNSCGIFWSGTCDPNLNCIKQTAESSCFQANAIPQ